MYLLSFLILPSLWRGTVSWLLDFKCHLDVLWQLELCGSSSRCRGLVCSVWLWYFLIILTYLFQVLKIKTKTNKKEPKQFFSGKLESFDRNWLFSDSVLVIKWEWVTMQAVRHMSNKLVKLISSKIRSINLHVLLIVLYIILTSAWDFCTYRKALYAVSLELSLIAHTFRVGKYM